MGILLHFLTSIVAKHPKIEGCKKFGEKNSLKSLTMPNKTEGGTLWDFSTSILSQNNEKLKGGRFGELFLKKVSQRRKKLKLSLSRYGMLRGKRGKTFFS